MSRSLAKARRDKSEETVPGSPVGAAAGLADVQPRFLVIGDDGQVAPALQTVFGEPFDVVHIADTEEALRALGARGADVVLLDRALIAPGRPLTPERGQDDSGAVLWMAIDPKAVLLLGDLLRQVAKPNTARLQSVQGSMTPGTNASGKR